MTALIRFSISDSERDADDEEVVCEGTFCEGVTGRSITGFVTIAPSDLATTGVSDLIIAGLSVLVIAETSCLVIIGSSGSGLGVILTTSGWDSEGINITSGIGDSTFSTGNVGGGIVVSGGETSLVVSDKTEES